MARGDRARMTASFGRVPDPGTDLWRPVLLRVPDRFRVRPRPRIQVVRGSIVTTVGILTLFLALQFVLPARLVIGGMGAVGRPSVAVGLLLAILWVVSAVRPHALPGGRQPIRWAVGFFLAVQLVGYAVGFDRLPTAGQASAANRWLILVVSFAGVTLAVADGMRTRRDLDRLLRLVVFFACAMSLVGILQFFGVVDLTRHIRVPGLRLNTALILVSSRGDGNFPRVAGTANHYIEFGVVLALVLPIALHYVLFSPPGRSRLLAWIGMGIIAMGIPLSISRSAIVTVVVAMTLLATIWTWRQRYNALVISVVAIAVFHVVNRGVLGTIRSLFTNAENDPSITARIERTAKVLELWNQRPVLGWGAGMVTPEEFLLLDNQIYMFLLSGGMLGVAAFAVLLLVPYALGRSIRLRGRDEETRHLGQALALTMPAAFIASGTFDSFSFATFVAVVCVLVGAAGALWRLDGTTVLRPVHDGPQGSLVATPLMADVRGRLMGARDETRAPRSEQETPRSATRAEGQR